MNDSFLQVPIDEQAVTITKPVLLDTATARLGGVEIKDGGRLVFSPDVGKVALTTRWCNCNLRCIPMYQKNTCAVR